MNTVAMVTALWGAATELGQSSLFRAAEWGHALALAGFAIAVGTISWELGDAYARARVIGLSACCFLAATGAAEMLALADVSGPILGGVKLFAVAMSIIALALLLTDRPGLERMTAIRAVVHDVLAAHARGGEADRLRRHLEKQVREGAEALRGLRQLFETALRDAPISVTTQDRQFRFTWAHNPLGQQDSRSIVGLSDEDVLPAEGARSIKSIKKRVLDTGEAKREEIALDTDTGSKFYDLMIEPLEDHSGNIVGVITVAVDITEQKASAERLNNLLLEVSHRSKNLLAIVQSLARQTANRALSKEVFVDRFLARVRSLSHAQDLLVNADWRAVSLEDLLRLELNALGQWPDRLTISGERILVKPEVAQSFALNFHELASNAVKYGALSSPTGVIFVGWKVVRGKTGPVVELVWRETGGPGISAPVMPGLGQDILRKTIEYGLSGKLDLEFRAEGLACRMAFPAHQFAELAADAREQSARSRH